MILNVGGGEIVPLIWWRWQHCNEYRALYYYCPLFVCLPSCLPERSSRYIQRYINLAQRRFFSWGEFWFGQILNWKLKLLKFLEFHSVYPLSDWVVGFVWMSFIFLIFCRQSAFHPFYYYASLGLISKIDNNFPATVKTPCLIANSLRTCVLAGCLAPAWASIHPLGSQAN